MNFLTVLLLSLTIGHSICSEVSYDDHVLIRAIPNNLEQLNLIISLSHNEDFDVWNRIKGVNQSVNIFLSSKAFSIYKELFDSAKIFYEITSRDVQKLIDEQKSSVRTKRSLNIVGTFARYNDILSFLNTIVAQNPRIASLNVLGQTFEKRNLTTLVLKTTTSRRSIWIDCGIHAREWISPATCVWIINKLVTEYNSNDSITVALLNYFEIHIMPVLNPDGYEYSHTTSRLWRKNRRPNPGSSCIGTDLNRNSGYQWMTGGSSSNVCSDIYAGPSANSELEIQAMQRALNAKLGNWDAYLTLHTFGQYWFTNWGFTRTLPTDYTDLVAKANIGVAAIQRVNGQRWAVGSSTRLLGVASGGSEDWAKGVAKIKYAYCLELRPSGSSSDPDSIFGFTLPASRIPLAGEETYQGIKAFLNSIRL